MMTTRSSASRLCATTCAMVVAASVGAGPREAGAVQQLQHYCSASWRNARIDQQDWTDCTQATFAELLGRIKRGRLSRAIEQSDSDERRELNRSIWCVIQRWRRAPRHARLDSQPEDDAFQKQQDLLSDSEEVQRLLASTCLKPRQRQILFQWSHGVPVSQIAENLGMTPAQVSDEKYRAIKSLRQEFLA